MGCNNVGIVGDKKIRKVENLRKCQLRNQQSET